MSSPNTNKKHLEVIEAAYEHYYTQLYLYALNIMNDEEEAKDAVGDAFEAVWVRLKEGSFDEKAIKHYLYTTVRNNCINRLRHTEVTSNYVKLMKATSDFTVAGDADSLEDNVVTLYNEMDKLGEPDRTILENCYFNGLTYQETAERMGLTLSYVKKHMLKIFRKLRESLKKNN